MDPTTALREALEALVDAERSATSSTWPPASRPRAEDLESAAIRFRDLADWLDKGGFPPYINQNADGSFTVPHVSVR